MGRTTFTLALALASTSASAPPTSIIPLSSPRLAITGSSPSLGIFDPSLAATFNPSFPYALTFSEVQTTANISTALAVYDTALSAFVRVASVNSAAGPALYPCDNGVPCTATLVHEVSSLVFDASDPNPSQAVKVFTHSYLVLPPPASTLRYDWGYLALHTAANLTGPFASQPLLGWASSSPLSTTGVRQVLTELPELAHCLAFSEPGVLATPQGTLLLALTCITPPSPPAPTAPPTISIVLLTSASHGQSWAYAGTAVQGQEAEGLLPGQGALPQLSAPDLFATEESTFLSITPATPLWPGLTGYSGCLVLQLNGNLTGVVRDGQGAPVVHRVLRTDGLAFNGACTAAASPLLPGLGSFMMAVLTEGAAFSILPTAVLP
jgi:hypothetical protein